MELGSALFLFPSFSYFAIGNLLLFLNAQYVLLFSALGCIGICLSFLKWNPGRHQSWFMTNVILGFGVQSLFNYIVIILWLIYSIECEFLTSREAAETDFFFRTDWFHFAALTLPSLAYIGQIRRRYWLPVAGVFRKYNSGYSVAGAVFFNNPSYWRLSKLARFCGSIHLPSAAAGRRDGIHTNFFALVWEKGCMGHMLTGGLVSSR